MDENRIEDSELLQRLVARTIAVSPAGQGLILIGGFRYRLLDHSVRASRDVDYHWDGDLAEKQGELVALFKRTLLPEAQRAMQYEGSVAPATGPDDESTAVRIVNIAFWKPEVAHSRIEIPVEITRIAKMDSVVAPVRDGTVYLTVSEQDMVESKVIALLNRTFMKHRDFVDVYLFQNHLSDDSCHRLLTKFNELGVGEERINKRMSDFTDYPDYHAKAIQAVVDDQLEPAAAAAVNDAGGGQMILDAVVGLLGRYVLNTDGGQQR